MTSLRIYGLNGRPSGSAWAAAAPGGAFLRALQRCAPKLRLEERADLLLDQLVELEERRSQAGAEEPPYCPLWPPLLRAVHGIEPGPDPADRMGLAEPPELRPDPFSDLHADYRLFFDADVAWQGYRERLRGARRRGA